METEQLLTQPSREQVATFAYLIWQQEGCTHGHDLDDWLQAERQLQLTPTPPPPPILPEG